MPHRLTPFARAERRAQPQNRAKVQANRATLPGWRREPQRLKPTCVLFDLALLGLGGVMLYFGAEWLVRGAAGMARSLGLAPILIGLTVVSYGTSAPELAVSVLAAVEGQSDIALGNVVGSNIANIGLILGVTALIRPPAVDALLFRRELPVLWVASALLPLLLLDQLISHGEGALLVLLALSFTWFTFRWSKEGVRNLDLLEEVPTAKRPVPILVGWFVLGLVVLIGGGQLFVDSAVNLARDFGMSERVVGLTIVAFGTSVPELAASVVAALRGHSDLALGNVVGSNIFNICFVLGWTAVVRPVSGSLQASSLDLATMLLLTLAMTSSMRHARRVSRAEGGLYTSAYIGFAALAIWQL